MDDATREWADRTGEFSPRYYAHRGTDDVSELLADRLAEHVGRDARILELGCSVGRHLAHLHDRGFERLEGLEINEDARDVMEEHYPELAAAGEFHYEAIQDAVPEFETDAFDAIYSVETLQHVPPEDAWVYEELARVAADVVLTVEIESPGPDVEPTEPGVNYVDDEVPLYYRDWQSVFEDVGCEQLEVREPGRDVVRVFETPEA